MGLYVMEGFQLTLQYWARIQGSEIGLVAARKIHSLGTMDIFAFVPRNLNCT